ncbi:hypothetical protein PIROE2DRAFT_2235 [Piromyces sp. E2]|nr:hypothetical protein PIROE2DRAFT_2235 [Piromyces sp. E2]|eukprot:OUM69807.1 hypothetical protein PIROE2DRAFT_2235 [Piromyces sp. E2]
MVKDAETYNLSEKLSKTNANISFTQLFCVSPYLRKICMKADKEILNKINKISKFDDLDDLEKAFSISNASIAVVVGFLDNLVIKALIDTGCKDITISLEKLMLRSTLH